MPAPRINLRKIKDVLRLKLDAKLSRRQIAAALGTSKAAVTKYLGLAAAAGDDAGPTIGLTDGSRAHIFVAALGTSSYTCACATPRETMAELRREFDAMSALYYHGNVVHQDYLLTRAQAR